MSAKVPGTAALDRFAHVDAWVFDLDNTLYPRHTDLFRQVDVRIREFVQRALSLPPDEAQRLQKDYYQRYGTTLRGLIVEHGIAAGDFLQYVHDIDHSAVQPDPALSDAIENLPGKKFILTNGSRAHAEKVAARLGITHHFSDIFDIVRLDLLPKPAEVSYRRFIEETGVRPERAAMFEDLSRNLTVPKALGMATVLVVPSAAAEVLTEAWEQEGREGEHIDFVTDDLGTFLGDVLSANGRRA
ncbi:MAG: pyrimidine 5'-nucleotidase [Rhizobiales bacterium]|nr:pyrimidine 5'-nucleotidase [Hyphomicrobiales bacterium]